MLLYVTDIVSFFQFSVFCCMNTLQCIYSIGDGHLGCFHTVAVTNVDVVNILVCAFCTCA